MMAQFDSADCQYVNLHLLPMQPDGHLPKDIQDVLGYMQFISKAFSPKVSIYVTAAAILILN